MHRKLRFLTFSIVAAFAIGIVAALAFGASNAEAHAGYNTACESCHSFRGGTLRVSTDIDAKTVAPGEIFTADISWTGGSGHIEINWPDTQDNAQFSPSPQIPYSGSGMSSGSTTSTLTAPSTPGIYDVRVYASSASPSMQTDYKDMAITVEVPVTYTIIASAGAHGSISPSGTVTVSSGDSQAFTITANGGYHVADVLVDGASVGAVTGYNFTGVTDDHTISASFAADTVANVPSCDDEDDEEEDGPPAYQYRNHERNRPLYDFNGYHHSRYFHERHRIMERESDD
jgi:hypothetical protein